VEEIRKVSLLATVSQYLPEPDQSGLRVLCLHRCELGVLLCHAEPVFELKALRLQLRVRNTGCING
jgi:hypothetical protein